MEYLIYLALFLGGWVLSKFDTRSRVRPMLKQVVEESYRAGATFGCEETLKALAKHHKESVEKAVAEHHQDTEEESGETLNMGFAIPKVTSKTE